MVAAIAFLVAGLKWRLRQSLPEAGARIAPVSVTMLAPIGRAQGWQIQRFTRLTWAEPLFGQGSQVSLFRISQSGQPDVWAQVVLTTDAGALAAHSVVDCDLFHGNKIFGSQRRDVAPGLPADAVVARDPFGHGFAELTWSQPFRVEEHSLVRRIELLTLRQLDGDVGLVLFSLLVKIGNQISTTQP